MDNQWVGAVSALHNPPRTSNIDISNADNKSTNNERASSRTRRDSRGVSSNNNMHSDWLNWTGRHRKLLKEEDDYGKLSNGISEMVKDSMMEAKEFAGNRDSLKKSLTRSIVTTKVSPETRRPFCI
jgi:hypothetical protein